MAQNEPIIPALNLHQLKGNILLKTALSCTKPYFHEK